MTPSPFNAILTDRIPASLRKPVRNGFLAGILAAGICIFIPNHYKSEARILPADTRSGGGAIGQMAAAAEAMGVSSPGQDSSSDSAFVDVLNSRWTAKKLLEENYQFKSQGWMFGAVHDHHESLYNFLKAKNIDRAILKLKSIMTVNRDTKSKLLTITVTTTSPQLSQQIVRKAEAILENFIEVKARTRGGNKAVFTAQRIKEAQAAAAEAEQENEEFLDSHRNYATSNEPAVRLKGARLDATLKLRQQVLTTLTLNYEQALLEEKNDMPILNILDDGDQPMEKSGPPRGTIVLFAMLLAGGLTWLLPFFRKPGQFDPMALSKEAISSFLK